MFTKTRSRTKAATLLVILLLLGLPWHQTLAHAGGTLQVTGEVAGPYLVTVWTSPPNARANGPLHITVGVADAETDEIVLDARIMTEVEFVGGTGTIMSGEATIVQSVSKLLYETAEFPIAQSGRYRILVSVSGEKGQGQVEFEMEVLPALNTNWLLVGIGGVGVVGAAFLFRSWKGQTASQMVTPPRRKPKRPLVD